MFKKIKTTCNSIGLLFLVIFGAFAVKIFEVIMKIVRI